MTEELYQFVVSDYYATGEGRTVCLLITRAYPWSDDYDKTSTQEGVDYCPTKLKNNAKFRAGREFIERFGGYLAQGSENLARAEFIKKYGHYLPGFAKNLLENPSQPGNFHFAQEFHLNYS